MNNSPKLLIIAGANGSGKTTFTEEALEKHKDIETQVNADFVERTVERIKNIDDPKKRSLEARLLVERMKEELLLRQRSFVYETVFSHPSKLDFMNKAKQKGYELHSVYITTKDPKINVQRVADRVKKGGHDVPEEKIISRHKRSLDLLHQIIMKSDYSEVYDNSSKEPILVCGKSNKGIEIYTKDINWVNENIIKPLTFKNVKVKIVNKKPELKNEKQINIKR